MRSHTPKVTPVVLGLMICLVLMGISSVAQVRRSIDDSDRVTIHGDVHPLAQPQFDRGSADPNLAMDKMILALSVRPGTEAQLNQLLREQQDPASPNFHKWLTPQEFGLRFGPTDQDLADVTGWLKSHGFRVEEITSGRLSVNFSGNVQQVERAFQTNIRQFEINGKMYHANATAPSIPRAFSGLVQGVVSLHNFPKHRNSNAQQLPPDFTTTAGIHFLSPGDFSTIYNVSALYTAGIDGTGQSIAIVGRTDINLSDVQFFRSFFGLPAKDPIFIHNGADPGNLGGGEETEADLDVEWSGAIARNATINFVISASTAATDGVDLSAQFIVNNNVANIMSTSFGLCEAALGATGNNFWGNLWTQAAAQGITSFVSSGDSGAAGCDPANAFSGTGQAVSGLSSTPNNIAVGGTQFNEGNSSFWSAGNNPADQSSALSYIPEIAWNESLSNPGGSGLLSSGGGASIVYLKPAFQFGTGVPADGVRDVPDVSLSSAGHDGYLIVQGHSAGSSGLAAVGGTSAASPSFAGLMALVVQETGTAQGNANPVLYSMARNQLAGGTVVYHDITSGNNTVPNVVGFTAGTGYDQVTGWGSVDAANLVNFWNNNAPVVDFSLSATPGSQSISQGASTSYTVTVSPINGYSGTVSFGVTGLPTGTTASLVPASVTASGTTTLSISTLNTTPAGSFNLTITGSDGVLTHTASVVLVINGPPDFSISVSPASQSVQQGASGTYNVSISPSGGFNNTVQFSVTGVPAGASASFSPTTVVGSGSSALNITTTNSTPTGSYTLTIQGAAGGLTHTTTATLVVTAAATDFTVSAFPSSQSVSAGSNTGYGITIGSVGGFNGVVNLSVSGLPSGATGSFSATSVTASGTVTLTVFTSTTTPTGSYPVVVTGTSGAVSHTSTVTLTVTPAVPPPPPPPPPGITAAVSVSGNAQVPVPNVGQAGNIVWTISDTTTTTAPNVVFQTNVPSNPTGSMQLNTIAVTVNNSGTFVCTFTPTGGSAVSCASAPVSTAGGVIQVTTPNLGGSTKNGNKPPQTMIVTVNVTNPAGTTKGTVFTSTGTMTFGPGGTDSLPNSATVKITSN